MKKDRDKKQAVWQRLSAIVAKVERKQFRSITPEEISELDTLYRLTTKHLSEARTRDVDPQQVLFLNGLIGRAHQIIYVPPRRKKGVLLPFLWGGYSRLIRRKAAFVAASTFLFIFPAAVSFFAVKLNPTAAYSLWQEKYISFEEERLSQETGEYRGNFTFSKEESSRISGEIMTNNIRVTMLAFAGGVLAGSLTVFLLIYNGIMLGTLCGVVDNHGFSGDFLTLILTHGVIELTMICIAGASGLMLGRAILFPGTRTRLDALQEDGRDALLVFAGTLPFILLAGLIEGFITPHTGEGFRIIIIILTAALMVFYFGFVGLGSRNGKGAHGKAPPPLHLEMPLE